ncbi:MAG TPA: hypothetical protein VHE34_24140 [Puia sp.]|uniref:hypothetical protein n=1 Tax=Puia sp. TaxID=2045100 RepID=UPI002BB81EC4|nr:hypothetical protein [Puia sp.]HVU98345.1 hypothetical protein [Puia sp.]
MRPVNPYILALATVLFAACSSNTQKAKTAPPPLSDSARAASFVTHFLRWYAEKYDSLDHFHLVNIPESDDSGWNTLDLAQTKSYLNALRSSGYFTGQFLAEKEAYFRQCDSFFNAKKENNHSPTGFDFDLVLSSSQTGEFLADSVNPNVTVSLPTVIFDKYLVFTLQCSGDTCRIDKVHYRVDPDKFADEVYVPGADSSDPAIRKIKAEVQQIRANAAKYRMVANDLEGVSSEGGDDTLYYEGNRLRKAASQLFGSIGNARSDYYFTDGKMRFAIYREIQYTKPFTIPNYDIGMIRTTRYYFQDGRLFRCIDEKGKLVDKGLYPAILKELATEDSVFLPTFSR